MLRGTASQGAQVRFKNLTMPSAGVWTGDVKYKVNGYRGDEDGAQSD